jgi:hypothetical protein
MLNIVLKLHKAASENLLVSDATKNCANRIYVTQGGQDESLLRPWSVFTVLTLLLEIGL